MGPQLGWPAALPSSDGVDGHFASIILAMGTSLGSFRLSTSSSGGVSLAWDSF